jgi:hypothetical protein
LPAWPGVFALPDEFVIYAILGVNL